MEIDKERNRKQKQKNIRHLSQLKAKFPKKKRLNATQKKN